MSNRKQEALQTRVTTH